MQKLKVQKLDTLLLKLKLTSGINFLY